MTQSDMWKAMFGIILVNTIRTLFQTPRWWQKIIPGGALNLLPVLVLVLILTEQIGVEVGGVLLVVTFGLLFITWGYLYRIFVDALNGTESFNLPSWGNWWAYGVAGLWLFLIVLGYGVISVAGFSMLISVLGLIPRSVEEAGSLSLLFTLLVIFFYVFFPIVFTRFAAEGRVWMAFEPGPVWRDLRQIVRADYIQACFGLFGISLLGSLILGHLSWVGLILASMFNFFLLAVFTRVLGLLIRRALKSGPPAQSEYWN
ncbi:MAG: DUF4013 domain-containing protein [Gemmatimonadetes bacterium]|nr:DUF4013 domain-containing protein [Gemmatimonadota bacterium]